MRLINQKKVDNKKPTANEVHAITGKTTLLLLSSNMSTTLNNINDN